MNKLRILIYLLLIVLFLIIINLSTIEVTSVTIPNIKKIIFSQKILYIFLMSFLLYISINQLYCKTNELFTATTLLGDRSGNVNKVDLIHFFQFIEYFQIDYLNIDGENVESLTSNYNIEYIRINNSIKDLLDALNLLVNTNNKDNYYNRFLIHKLGTNLSTKKINIHNYYTYKNIKINPIALKILLELLQENNYNVFSIMKPTEINIFENELILPLKIIYNSILKIIYTDIYKEYLHNQKFDLKYSGLIFNPNLIKI